MSKVKLIHRCRSHLIHLVAIDMTFSIVCQRLQGVTTSRIGAGNLLHGFVYGCPMNQSSPDDPIVRLLGVRSLMPHCAEHQPKVANLKESFDYSIRGFDDMTECFESVEAPQVAKYNHGACWS